MADIKWIKLTTDMFDNRKIKQIRHLPEGNNIVLIWVMLLTIAGRCNAGGMIFLTENIPYKLDSLAVELDFDKTVVQLALDVLQKFGMIVCDEESFYISNWEEYQNIEGMEKVREQNRLRKQAQRERERKLLAENAEMSRDSHVPSQQSHATDKDIERDKDIKNKNINKNNIFVKPSLEEVKAYCQERGNNVDAEAFIDFYESKGWKIGSNSMKDWKAAIRNWERSDRGSAGTNKSGTSEKDRKRQEVARKYAGRNFYDN